MRSNPHWQHASVQMGSGEGSNSRGDDGSPPPRRTRRPLWRLRCSGDSSRRLSRTARRPAPRCARGEPAWVSSSEESLESSSDGKNSRRR